MKFVVFAVAFWIINCFASGEILMGQNAETWLRLDSFNFKPSLSQDEVAFVTNSLVAPKYIIVETALCVMVVHNIPITFPSGEGAIRESGRIIAKIIESGRERKQSPVDFLRKDHYRDDITHFTVHGFTSKLSDSSYMGINEKLGRIAAVFFAREMRQGKNITFNEDDYSFSDYDKLLLKYAKYPEREVPRMIISALAKVKRLTMVEYDLAKVLVSYDDINLDLILSTLQKRYRNKYAKMILLEVLTRKSNDLGSLDREKIRGALKNFNFKAIGMERAKSKLFQDEPPKK